MASIKINYYNNEEDRRTSTTFTEITARFFLEAWYEDGAWTEMQKQKIFYRDLDEVKKAFQQSINEMMEHMDNYYKLHGLTEQYWNKTLLEYNIMCIIRSGK